MFYQTVKGRQLNWTDQLPVRLLLVASELKMLGMWRSDFELYSILENYY